MSDHAPQTLLTNRWIMVPVILVTVAGAVVSIAGGFLLIYKLVTLIGNS